MLKWTSYYFFKSVELISKNKSLRWNHYKALGLQPTASLSDIKAAYYKLSKIYHPDRNDGCEESAKRFHRISAAYEILSKAESRKQYDKEIIKEYEALKKNFGFSKKATKQIKKHSSKGQIRSKFKQNGSKEGTKHAMNQKDFENLVGRTIPLVIACMLSCKKR